MKKLFLVVLLSSLVLPSAQARLGEPLAKLKERLGKHLPQTRKDSATWVFEGVDGQLVYTATFNAKGESIAEGLKPVKYGRLMHDDAENFIDVQLGPLRGAKTARTMNPGEKYRFGGKDFVCGDQEFVIVDETNGILIVWTKVGLPSVMAVGPEMIK